MFETRVRVPWPALVLALAACSGPRAVTETGVVPAPLPAAVPAARREFRAVWIATVANIDWPSRPGLGVRVQQDELRAILDQAAATGLNAVILQVRPMADALYRSRLEPVSYYLTGVQGSDPGYDPLAFAVDEAHRRGIELHAWFNPFRAGHPTNGPPDSSHVLRSRPGWVLRYGDLDWLDPGIPDVREHTLAVIADVVSRYDIDGIHVDDYFYPYPIRDSTGAAVPFPDSTSWSAALAAGETLSHADWRRAQVDGLIEAMYRRTRELKPWVKVGISPFGIWRPGHPAGVTGFDPYEGLHADARRWLREGWVDYLTPQLYWAMTSEGQPYGPLLEWWAAENTHGRHLWPGNFTSRILPAGGADWTPEEIVGQIRLTRGVTDGNVHFSMRAIMPGTGVDEALATAVYGEPALVPETGWLGGIAPGLPRATLRRLGTRVLVDLLPGAEGEPFLWHLRVLTEGAWKILLVPAWRRTVELASMPERIVVSAVNRLGQEGPAFDVQP